VEENADSEPLAGVVVIVVSSSGIVGKEYIRSCSDVSGGKGDGVTRITGTSC
jgi:hypothetical protein